MSFVTLRDGKQQVKRKTDLVKVENPERVAVTHDEGLYSPMLECGGDTEKVSTD